MVKVIKIMKICHITSVHSRNDVRIFQRECTSLAKDPENEVIFICCDGKDREEKSNVKIISYSNIELTKKERLKLLFFNQRFIDYLQALHADFYQFHDFELSEIGRKLARRGNKVIFDSHENWIGNVAHLFSKKRNSILNKLVRKFIDSYYKFTLKRFSAVFTVSPNMVDDLKKYTRNVYFVPNYPSVKGIQNRVIDNLSNNEFVFQGTVYDISNQETIVKALQRLKNNSTYKIIGKISESLKSNVEKLDQKKRVNILGWISPEELNVQMSNSIAGMVILDYSVVCCYEEGQLGSNKIFEYMKIGLPVICTDFKLWKELIIDKYCCGIAIPPQNVEKMKDAMEYIISNKEEAVEMGKRGQEAIIKEFNWELYEDEFVNRYKIL